MKKDLHFLIIFISFSVAGCASLLPSARQTVESPWGDFESAKADYEKIIPGKTTVADLKQMGVEPHIVPNIKILNATEIINLFMPNPSIGKADLNEGVLKCIESKDRCTAYLMTPSFIKADRVGNFWLDLFGFRRETLTTGWEFRGLIVIVNGVVTYRDPVGGRPFIRTEDVQKKPLGPLQDIGGILQSLPPAYARP